MIKHREKSFEKSTEAVDKGVSAAKVECVALRLNLDEVVSKLKVLETDLGKSLKSLSEQTIESSTMMSKQFETEVTKGLERIFGEFKYVAAKISGKLESSSPESTLGTQLGIPNCIAMLSNRLARVVEASSVKPSTFTSGATASAARTSPSTSTG